MIEPIPPASDSAESDCERIVVMLVEGPFDGQDILANRVEVARGLLVRNEQIYVKSGCGNPWQNSTAIPLFRWLAVWKES